MTFISPQYKSGQTILAGYVVYAHDYQEASATCVALWGVRQLCLFDPFQSE